MAGHSHASNIKHRKAAVDGKRAKIFTRWSRAITACVREKGKDPDMNPTLRMLTDKARGDNMPNDAIEKAILRGAGELPGVMLTESTYEGYANDGVAIIIDTLTDNSNRTTPEIRHLFTKAGGSMGAVGCVSWDFNTCGLIKILSEGVDEDELMILVLDAGADDMAQSDGLFEISTAPESFLKVNEALIEAGHNVESAELTKIANNKVELDEEKTQKVLNFIDKLEEHGDVQAVYTNLIIPEELLDDE